MSEQITPVKQLELKIPSSLDVSLTHDLVLVLSYIDSVLEVRADKLREVCHHLKTNPNASVEVNGKVMRDPKELAAFMLGIQFAVDAMGSSPYRVEASRLTPAFRPND